MAFITCCCAEASDKNCDSCKQYHKIVPDATFVNPNWSWGLKGVPKINELAEEISEEKGV